MDNGILKGLNAAQRTAVASTASVLQVLAPPGSGKTKTLTARVAYLIAHQQLRPWNIIVCTFTVKAANEMKERIKAFIGDDLAKQLKLGTFHSVALRYLKHYGHLIGLAKDFGIADTADSKAILKRIIKKLDFSMQPSQALGRISTRKVKGELPQKGSKNVEQQEFARLFAEYEATLAASNLLDYDDILLRCCTLLREHAECVSNVQAVLIDEFQDTNNTQYDLMSLFAQKQNAITIVGDPDQSIYGFRMAEIKNLGRMRTQWSDTLTITLEENYRSSGAILHAAQKIIEQDESRPSKKLQATHSFGMRPVLRKLPSAAVEADWLVSEIKRIQALTGDMLQASDFAILLRSAALSRAIETSLGNAGMAYRMVGGTKFYDRSEVKLVIDYLRVIHQPGNNEAVERIINMPPRRIGDETIKKLREEARSKQISLWDLVSRSAQGRCSTKTKLTEPVRKGLSAFVNVILSGQVKKTSWETEQPCLVELMNVVIQKISLQSFLKSKYAEEETYEARWSNIEELLAQAAEFSSPAKIREIIEANGLPLIEDVEQSQETLEDILSVFLANVALTAAAEQKVERDGQEVQQVTISTIHAAKGLEWPVVFIPACFDGSIPHSRADDHDEERRLLYVGMTRAQALLYLSCPMKNTQREETSMSTFLTQPGVNAYFEEHGPSLPLSAVSSLAMTVRRECPADAIIAESKEGLERDEDSHWPLNGEELLRELSQWQNSSSYTSVPGFDSARPAEWTHSSHVTMQQQGGLSMLGAAMPGFTSVASRYDELMEQSRERKLDKRVEQREKAAPVKGRKRQIEGQGNIATMIGKRSKLDSGEARGHQTVRYPEESVRNPLIATNAQRTDVQASTRSAMLARKPQSQPSFRRPTVSRHTEGQENGNHYMFLSSSPSKDIDESPSQPELPTTKVSTTTSGHQQNGFRPASTFHTTSVQHTATQRKTLGVRRSLQGWTAGSKH